MQHVTAGMNIQERQTGYLSANVISRGAHKMSSVVLHLDPVLNLCLHRRICELDPACALGSLKPQGTLPHSPYNHGCAQFYQTLHSSGKIPIRQRLHAVLAAGWSHKECLPLLKGISEHHLCICKQMNPSLCSHVLFPQDPHHLTHPCIHPTPYGVGLALR
jgi:hypothetical protein